MAKTSYHIPPKGYVGGYDFYRSTVDRELARNDGKRVNVLIDSLGGSLATGLSISAAFKKHGNVNVHFVGLNASAATIASLGAAHISIDDGAMYLVHKCSMALFSALQSAIGDNEWGSLNADQFTTLIADCEKVKADLDKLDLNVASSIISQPSASELIQIVATIKSAIMRSRYLAAKSVNKRALALYFHIGEYIDLRKMRSFCREWQDVFHRYC